MNEWMDEWVNELMNEDPPALPHPPFPHSWDQDEDRTKLTGFLKPREMPPSAGRAGFSL